MMIGFLTVFGLMGSALAASLFVVHAQADVTTLLIHHLQPARISARKLQLYALRADDHEGYVVMAQTARQLAENLQAYDDDLKQVVYLIAQLKVQADTDAQRAMLTTFEQLWSGRNAYLARNGRAIALRRAGKSRQAQAAYFRSSADPVIKLAGRYISECNRLATAAEDRQASLQRFVATAAIGGALAALVLGLGIVYMLVRSIDERQRTEEQLAHLAFHDPLTGLPNRALFDDCVRSAIARTHRTGQRLAVLFLDVDRFKLVNDTLGHLIGDQLLIAIARRLEGCLSSGDVVARQGGDEFTILLEESARDLASIAARIAERLLKAFSASFVVGEQEVYATASIGIALSSPGTTTPEDLLRDADIAMYRAKVLGKHRFELFAIGQREAPKRLLEMETGLRRALDRSELTIAYQPIISLADGRLTAFEALARWEHAELGSVSPTEFIPIAEETGLIRLLGEWVLREALTQTRRWQQAFSAHASLCVSVNVSARQMQDDRFVEYVRAGLAQSGLGAEHLQVEITESCLISDPLRATAALHELRALGVKVHMDDFGTGYSSLAYVHKLPIDALKIDRSFVCGHDKAIANPDIVQTVIALAGQLGLETIAEGVQTEEQETQLYALRCTYAQGYHFAKPLNVEAAARYLDNAYERLPFELGSRRRNVRGLRSRRLPSASA
jgi:diguanylate cyclase (GGDEF)-like protein